jgi:hypothetical protein
MRLRPYGGPGGLGVFLQARYLCTEKSAILVRFRREESAVFEPSVSYTRWPPHVSLLCLNVKFGRSTQEFHEYQNSSGTLRADNCKVVS